MKYLKMLGLAAVAAMALMAFAAGSASATTLTTKGVAENAAVSITATIKSGTTATLQTTDKSTLVDTCTGSEVKGTTASPFTGATVGGSVSSLTWSGCSHTTDTIKPGSLSIAWTSGTNGTVTSKQAEVTVKSTTFGVSVTCKTNEGTNIGTLTGVKEGTATMDINATVDCGLFSALWSGTYSVTSPANLGVHS
jgi:hypothetical protein